MQVFLVFPVRLSRNPSESKCGTAVMVLTLGQIIGVASHSHHDHLSLGSFGLAPLRQNLRASCSTKGL